jgi:hypothetical protein
MRSTLLAVVVLILAMTAPTGAAADLSIYDGAMTFQSIQGPDGPEEFSWKVNLYEGQYLQQVDETHAGVFYEEGHPAFSIEAIAAHAADGATVPTTLAVTQPNVITLTVHHRDGNPAAGGAVFDYPVIAGSGWEGGIKTEPAVVLEPDRHGPPSPPTCVVPDLTARTLRASRKILHQAHCRLGAVRGEQIRTAHVVTQFRQSGKLLPLWTKVDVKALPGLQYSRSN